MNNSNSVKYVVLKKYCDESGFTINAMRALIKKGHIQIDKHFCKAPNGRILIKIENMELWIQNRVV